MFKYLIAFFLGYFILSRVFGPWVVVKRNSSKASSTPPNDAKPKSYEKEYPSQKGEYIDYEEVK